MITYNDLRSAVERNAVGLRVRADLVPLGGPGTPIYPATYGVDRGATSKYALVGHRADEGTADSALVDSVASQANRMEVALLEAVREEEVALPLVSVDFRETEAEWLDRLSSLEVSHRIFDASLRDSLLDGVAFRFSDVGRAVTEATGRNAAALFRYAPTALVFGAWDSTGPKGGLGAKYERALTSEIVAHDVRLGVKTASRLDPTGIERGAGPLYQVAGKPDEWTLDAAEAEKDAKSGKPLSFGKGEDAGRPSNANFGNVTPSIDSLAGGIVADRIVATTVLSFIQLRRLRFPLDVAGTALSGVDRKRAEVAARTALAALGIAAVALSLDDGFDLRSRCVLVPDGEPVAELVGRNGDVTAVTIDRDGAVALLAESAQKAAEAGMAWESAEILLEPAPRLVQLIVRSQHARQAQPADIDEAQ